MSLCHFCLTFTSVLFFSVARPVSAQISKGFQILTNRGFQVQGMVRNTDPFHLTTYSNANYASINWLWDSTPSSMGNAPGFPWARWVSSETNMPPQGSEGPYLSQIVALQLGDEWELNDTATRTRLINWFNSVRTNWPNTILFHNNYGGQVGDGPLGDFISQAQPDMISFDRYPFRSDNSDTSPGDTPIHWYGDARRYREYSKGYNLPLAIYVQTYYSDSEKVRSPSPSELRLLHFAALAFNAKTLIDFTYNTGASSLFNNGAGGDNSPNSLYYEKADCSTRARNFGKALVRLKPIADAVPNSFTTGMMFIRGRDSTGTTNPIPIGFIADAQAPDNYTDWVYQRNDPYLSGWVVTNKAGVKNAGQPGDVILSWFTVLDESLDGAAFTNEVYLMVVNGLTDPTGTAADCLQEIKLNFTDAFTAVDILDPTTGQVTAQTLPVVNGKRQLVLYLNGGDAALFKFSDGAPFVGVTQAPSPPVITNQPDSVTNNAGTAATFAVTATGTSPLSYRWRFNGTNISGATATSYTRTNVQPADAGSYTVVVTNVAGSVTSDVAPLTVYVPPQITTQPQSRTVLAGSNVLFSVTATGTPSPGYQWRFNGTNISGATAPSYTRTNAQAADAGNYSVLVSNAAGTVTSSNALLTVNSPPTITAQPQNQTVLTGANAIFNVSATGTAPLAYQWRKNSSNLSNGGNVSGATSSALTLTNIQSADVASYTVVVSNAYGTATSAPAALAIATPPVIQVQPQSQTNNFGTLAAFNVVSTGNGLTYQWLRAGTNLSDGGNISGAAGDTLALNGVTRFDAASYTVVITNAAGSVTSAPATLTVLYALPFHEPFDYAAGANLGGQTSPDFLTWADVGTNTAGPYVTIQSGNLNVANLAPSTGNSILFGGLGKSARLSFQSGHPVTTGTLYYSFAFKVLDLTGASAGGGFIAGFNNSIGPQGNQPSVVGTRLYLRTASGGFNLGVAKNSSNTNDWVWDSTVLNTNQTIFLVGSYTFTTLGITNDDVCKLWINPSSTDFGAPNAPAPSLVATNGSDISSDQIASFVFFQRSSTVEPAAMVADELRMDTSWAGVTPGLAPVIVSQPQSRINNAGTIATFSVSATGTYLSYLWERNGVPLADGGNVSGAATATLTLTGVTLADAATYTVVVYNSGGPILSAPATLTLNAPPQISVQPQSQAVSFGGTAGFSVTASGTAPLAYQLRFNGTNIAGATNSNYSRTDVQRSDGGNYSAVITNFLGSAGSSNALLTINPVLPVHFDSITILQDGRVQLQGIGDPGNFAIEISSNLVNWLQLTNITGAGGAFSYTDSAATLPQRFYRIRLAP